MTNIPVKLIILDLDGTLYNQNILRFVNSVTLIINLFKRSLTISDIFILFNFRKEQERYSDNEQPLNHIIDSLAVKFKRPPADIRRIRAKWMIDNQSKALRTAKRRWLAKRISRLRRSGIAVAIWSDNPIEKKLAYLSYHPDYCLSNENEEVGIGKPNPKGLLQILSFFEIPKTQTILIGDREDRDGAAAARAGVRFIKVGFACRQFLRRLNSDLEKEHKVD